MYVSGQSGCDQDLIRTLIFGFTLKEKGPTGWVIDLTVPGLHKTSRCYGPAITPVSSLVVPSLEKLIDVRKGDDWVSKRTMHLRCTYQQDVS